DGHVRTDVDELADAVTNAVRRADHSVVIVDEPTFDTPAGPVPVLVVDGIAVSPHAALLFADGGDGGAVATEIERRLGRDGQSERLFRRSAAGKLTLSVRGAGSGEAEKADVVA